MDPWPAVVGICSAMCADEEVRRRKAERRRHVLERCTSGDIRMVKEYRRSAAGVDLCNSRHLRTIEALLMTSDYLIDNILDRKDVSWPVVYEFVADRFRSILQDITIQRLCCETTAGIVLRCLRFFIYAGYRLGTSWPGFQAKLNGDMIQQCISQLLFCYDGSSVHSCRCQNEWAEFAAIYLLYNLDSSEPCVYILSQPTKRRQHPLISLAFKIFLAKTTRNYVRFFRLVDQLPAACLSCAIHRHVKKFHRLALKVMSTAYSMKNCLYPLKNLATILALESEEEAGALCAEHGIEVKEGSAIFQKGSYQESSKKDPLSRYSFIDKFLTDDVKIFDIIKGHFSKK